MLLFYFILFFGAIFTHTSTHTHTLLHTCCLNFAMETVVSHDRQYLKGTQNIEEDTQGENIQYFGYNKQCDHTYEHINGRLTASSSDNDHIDILFWYFLYTHIHIHENYQCDKPLYSIMMIVKKSLNLCDSEAVNFPTSFTHRYYILNSLFQLIIHHFLKVLSNSLIDKCNDKNYL